MIIFSLGPANISERVRKALTLPDICHRDSEFCSMLAEVKEMILQAAGVDKTYESVLFGGSGTLAIEAVIAAFKGCPKKILIISNGVYGERAARIAGLHSVNFTEARFEWGERLDLSRIESELKKDDFIALYLVHHETSTGILNSLKDICEIAGRYNKLVLVDAVSSFAGEEMDIARWGIDAFLCSANKCICGVPGVSFAVLSQRFRGAIQGLKSDSLYAGLSLYLKAENSNQMPFTAPVQVFYALREALRELLQEGVENRIKKYREISACLRQGLEVLGFKFYIPHELMSNTMTVVRMPEGKSYAGLHDALKKRGFVIYASQGELYESTFRLGTVGLIFKKDITRFLKVLKGLL